MVHVWDNAGKHISGICGAVGGDEALGANLITDPGFDDAGYWAKGTGWTVADSKAVGNGGQNYSPIYKAQASQLGKLFKTSITISTRTSGSIKVGVGTDTAGTLRSTADTFVEYLVARTTGTLFGLFAWSDFVGTCDDIAFEPVTDCPATALKIVSTNGGDVHNWKHKDVGFNGNALNYNIQIMRAR
ncbi:hypothetical protein ES708_00744 [subsurface metagenome]